MVGTELPENQQRTASDRPFAANDENGSFLTVAHLVQRIPNETSYPDSLDRRNESS